MIEVYQANKHKVRQEFEQGAVTYIDLSSWTFADQFMAFLLSVDFFSHAVRSYPSPRVKEEVPLWILICCALQMKLHTTSSFSRLPGILGSGAILSRLGFNVAEQPGGGFNLKNRLDRTNPLEQDSVRKFYKDSDHQKQRQWYNKDLPSFFRAHRAFDKRGIFVLDQTHLVVPDNPHYVDVARMPVDEHGQRIDMSSMSEEQKKSIRYRNCYALSELLHVFSDQPGYIVAGYQLDAGNVDELPQGERLVKDFVDTAGPGVLQLLIVDRGYIDGKFISKVKTDYKADVMVPLKLSMDVLKDAVRLAQTNMGAHTEWNVYQKYEHRGVAITEEICIIDNPGIWVECTVPLYVSLMRIICGDTITRYWGLATTYKPSKPSEAFDTYGMRTSIEERHKQFKCSWNISKFSSPNRSLVETHVLFTLLTYSLVQLYLSKKHLSDLADKTIESLRKDERLGKDAVVVYGKHNFAVFDLDEYTSIIAHLQHQPREQFCGWLERFQKNGKMRIS
jgi:hypothetical protein